MRMQGGLAGEVRTLRGHLKAVDRSLQRLADLLRKQEEGNSSRSRRLSAKARASLVLQGRYMGYMRQLKPRQKAQVRKLKEAKGVRAAIARARDLAASA